LGSLFQNAAYFHGFASSAGSRKGTWLQTQFEKQGVHLHLPELTCPSFEQLNFDDALAAWDKFAESSKIPWNLIGSSMGGYLAARWSQLNPGRVRRLVLLCPGFDMVERWRKNLGEEAISQWQTTGFRAFQDAFGQWKQVSYRLLEVAEQHPAVPEVSCPTLIIHGLSDEVVPIESSRTYSKQRGHVRLIEVEDDHQLLANMSVIETETIRFFYS
jgi:uncharacterized protein